MRPRAAWLLVTVACSAPAAPAVVTAPAPSEPVVAAAPLDAAVPDAAAPDAAPPEPDVFVLEAEQSLAAATARWAELSVELAGLPRFRPKKLPRKLKRDYQA